MGSSCLLVIDMQNDFCDPASPLCVKGALGCLPHVKGQAAGMVGHPHMMVHACTYMLVTCTFHIPAEAVAHARKRGVPVFWVVREHHPSGGWHVAGMCNATPQMGFRLA